MNRLALVIGALMTLAVASGATGQTNPPPAGTTTAPSAGADVRSGSPARSDRPGVDININKKDDTVTRNDRDAGAALPRAASDRTTIFGLSPTAAVIVAAALLVIVILAIVAMTRGGNDTTYIDSDRRPPTV